MLKRQIGFMGLLILTGLSLILAAASKAGPPCDTRAFEAPCKEAPATILCSEISSVHCSTEKQIFFMINKFQCFPVADPKWDKECQLILQMDGSPVEDLCYLERSCRRSFPACTPNGPIAKTVYSTIFHDVHCIPNDKKPQ